ncbi:VOC family protein [Calidifontibacter terrae]
MSVRFAAAAITVADPSPVAVFWAELLGRTTVTDGRGHFLPGGPGQLPLRFIAGGGPGVDADRWHLHVSGDDPSDQERLVAAAVRLGATHLDVGQLPEEGHIVLADPSGGALCVLEPGNSFVAGCGPFSELACDGTRDVGLFWSQALGWELVWDQDEETAIQSPLGGTKIAWGGPPVAPRTTANRQRFELEVDHDEVESEVNRLRGLGAEPLGAHPGGIFEFQDPDGNEFNLLVRPALSATSL